MTAWPPHEIHGPLLLNKYIKKQTNKQTNKSICLTREAFLSLTNDKPLAFAVPDWIVGFWEKGNTDGVPGQKPLGQRRQPTTDSTNIWRRVRESNLGHVVGSEHSHHCATPALAVIVVIVVVAVVVVVVLGLLLLLLLLLSLLITLYLSVSRFNRCSKIVCWSPLYWWRGSLLLPLWDYDERGVWKKRVYHVAKVQIHVQLL